VTSEASIGHHGGRPGPAAEVLRASGIGKRFAGVVALDAVDFDLGAGEVHALVGENGAGKSTLMKILSGVHTDYEGELSVGGAPARFASVRDAERAGVAIIHQELNLVPELGVAANIFLGREPLVAGLVLDRRAMVAAGRRLLDRLGIELDPQARVAGLRVGEQQLVEIAKALSLEARILIMDEPTSALTPTECARLFRIVRQLAAEGVGVVYISHRLDEVMALADRVTVLRDGRNVVTAPIADVDRGRLIAAMVGRQAAGTVSARAPKGGAPVLEVRDLSLDVHSRRGWRRVLDGVGFEVGAGEVLGIAGLLGSGRTEILETLFGASEGRRGGRIRIEGRPVEVASPRDARRLGIALVTEDRKAKGLHLDASIRDNVTLPSLARLARFGIRSAGDEARMAGDAVRRLGVRCTGIEQVAATLSGGNQQKVVIGKWLATRPRVLLLDEPTRGIDVGAKQEIYDLVRTLAAEGLAIVLVSSELPELLLLADRIMVVSEGRRTGMLARAEASEETIMHLAAPRSRRVRALAS
jgi:ribose transport system ATP-binding protein